MKYTYTVMSGSVLTMYNVKLLSLSYILMIVGVMMLQILGVSIAVIMVATLFIYLPIFLKLYGLAGNISELGALLTGLLTGLIIFGDLMSIFGVLALFFGLFAGYIIGGLGLYLIAAIPLFISAFIYLKVSFGMKKGKEIWFSYAFLMIIFLGLSYLVINKY
jgi:hypothetical protein